jgi:serine protease Do
MKILKKLRQFFQCSLMGLICCSAVPTLGYAAEGMDAKQVANDFTAVAKKAIPAVVSINVKATPKQLNQNQKEQSPYENPFDPFSDDFFQRFFGSSPRMEQRAVSGQASGFVISPDGYVLTNNHVVDDFNEISVTSTDGKTYTAKVVGKDDSTDLAVLKIEAKGLPYLKFGNSTQLEVGQWVVAIGNSLGLQATLTVGVVSAKGRNGLDLARIEDFIQTDAAINRGNSGGPLLNLDGEVIGINTAIATTMAGGGYMGIGFAIPSNMAEHVVEQLISNGKVTRGFLGVSLQKVDEDLANAFGLEKPEGALVADVTKNSAAEKAGLKQGDIILKLNSQPVENISTFRNAIALMQPGAKATLTVLRDKKSIDVPIEVGSYSEKQEEVASAEKEANRFGLQVETLTPELAKRFSIRDESGVVITQVDPRSPFALVGVKKGAIILSVNQQNVDKAEDFYKIANSTEEGSPLLLLIKQGDEMRYVSIRVG